MGDLAPSISQEREDESNPLVSILIPAWGCRPYIGEAVESALGQTYDNFEVVVTEDCGTDGTYEEACRFRDSRLRVYRNDRNLGQYGNKNRALALARGSLLKYLDGDDVLEPDAVSFLVDAWRRSGPGTAVVFAGFTAIDPQGRFVARPCRWGIEGRRPGLAVLDHVLRAQLPGSRFGNVSPHLLERRALELAAGFPADNASPGDVETFCKLLAIGDVFFTEHETARFRVHGASMSSRTFGIRDCQDCVRMVERLQLWFAGREGLPPYLGRREFYREWMVWAAGHNIFPSLQRKLRGKASAYKEIEAMYGEMGLGQEFRSFVWRRGPDYVLRALATKVRRRFGLADGPPIFR